MSWYCIWFLRTVIIWVSSWHTAASLSRPFYLLKLFFFFFSPRTHPQLTPLLYLTSGVDGYYRTLCLLTPSGIHYLSSSHTFSHLFLQMNPVFLPLLLLLLLFRLWCSLLQASSLLVLLILFLTFKLRVFGFTTCLTTNWSLLMCSDEALNNSEHNWRFI